MKRLIGGILLVLLLGTGILAQAGGATPTPVGYSTYVVVAGDTLGGLALRFGTTTAALEQVNNIMNPNLIYVGEILIIPSGSVPILSSPIVSSVSVQPTAVPATVSGPAVATLLPVTLTPVPTTSSGSSGATAVPTNSSGAIISTVEPGNVPTAIVATVSGAELATPIPATFMPTPTLPPAPTATKSSPAQATAAPVVVTPASSLVFEWGGEIATFNNLGEMASTGMTWAKMVITWKEGDKADSLKSDIDKIHAAKLKALLQISGDPKEMTADFAHYGDDYAAFLGDVAALSPDAIEVWGSENTPDGWASGQIDPKAYSQMLTSAYDAIKKANSKVLVVSGALAQSIQFDGKCTAAGCDDVPFLQGMAAAGAGQSADCIGIDYTLGATSPDQTSNDSRGNQFIYYYESVVSTYASIFPNKPLCFTDLGYLVPKAGDSAHQWAAKTTAQNRADWIARAAQFAEQSGRILMLIVYNIDETKGAGANYAVIGSNSSCTVCDTLNTTLRG